MTGIAHKPSDLIPDDLRASAGPSVDQRRAASPSRHVWVRASAGSGKTKVLVDRLLRLLLPDPETGAYGVAPDKILCLTFTKAGAAEMALRLQKRLLEWSAVPEEKLIALIEDLTGALPDATMLAAARRLFAQVLDAPSSLKILTIHSFCQSVLSRFPVETGLSPDFEIIEETEDAQLLQEAVHDNLERGLRAPESDLGRVFSRLAISRNMAQLQDDIRQVIKEPIRLQTFLEDTTDLASIRAKLGRAFGLENPDAFSDGAFCSDAQIPFATLRRLASSLAGSSAKDIEKSDFLLNWLSLDEMARLDAVHAYRKIIAAKPLGKALKTDTDFLALQAEEMKRIDRCRLAGNIHATADLLYLSYRIMADYDRRKAALGVMDFNDLIFNTRRLLSGEFWSGDDDGNGAKRMATPWVLYKLDEGIDHILVDESQDTNPDQWDIVSRLSEEYFTGEARPVTRARTLFVVGDEKQSIFSFQRADPAEFHRMRDFFSEKIAALELQDGFEESLIYSFRSTAPVLKLTDTVFSDPVLKNHVGMDAQTTLRHISYRTDTRGENHGAVELMPLIVDAGTKTPLNGWQMPFAEEAGAVALPQRLARQVAAKIRDMVAAGEASPGDIMILVRTRGPLVQHLIRELKSLDLAVSGLDRIVLNESLIVQDLLAGADFALLPEDDFALAAFLKSPFVGLGEDELMALALNRPAGLWDRIRTHPAHSALTLWLDALIDAARWAQPYEFFERLLTSPCPADPQGSGYRAVAARLGPDATEAGDELLAQALKLELQDIRSLQEFNDYQRRASRDIKREMEESANEIRIMTVHASKGLEAGIVILPDTLSMPAKNRQEKFMWQDKSGLSAPIWAESADRRSDLYDRAAARVEELQAEEYSRLLYVAMTRARDRLIVCGAGKSETVNPRCWYALIRNGFEMLTDVETHEDGCKSYRAPGVPPPRVAASVPAVMPLPGWIFTHAPGEDLTVAVSPSRAADRLETDAPVMPPPALSPRIAGRADRFRRGLATHKLLQILPDVSNDRRETAARAYLARAALGFSEKLQDDITHEVMKILRDPVFAPVFGPGSLAEVPVTGDIGAGRIVNGQIDRLVITATDILIVDYKTNRPSPDNHADIPLAYRAQLRAYVAALRRIYPDRAVRCALLWTDRAVLMPVEL